MDTTVSDPLVGSVLDNRYRVDAHLARGGMAVVYRARDLRLDRTVAVKVMHRWLADDEEFVSRFIREAQSAARLSHPHVVAVYDQGRDHGGDNGTHVFLAMEYVEGRTLRDLLVERGALTPREAFALLDPVLAALSAAHQAGYVHRDIKPENVLLSHDGSVKVADFGLARAVAAPTVVTRSTGMLMGTVAYLSPEQVQRGVADARSDVYATGILLYEMLTGRPPHDGETALAVAYQHVHADVPAPSTRVSGLPHSVDDLVGRATRRNPDQRPADAAELRAEVAHVQAAMTPEQLDSGGPDAVVPTPGVPAGHTGDDDADPRARHTLVVPAALGAEPPAPDGRHPADGAGAEGHHRSRAAATPWWRGGRFAVVLVLVTALLVGLGAWWLGKGQYTQAPPLVGLSKASALAKLSEAGLEMYVSERERYSETVPPGFVVAASPDAGDQVSRLGGVTIWLSKGKERYAVPDVEGMTQARAERLLGNRHLTTGPVVRRYNTEVAENRVIRLSPEPGEMVRRDTAVRLVVSKGPPPVSVPDVRGRTQAEAEAILQDAGLATAVSTDYSDTVPEGYVVTTSPEPGLTADLGSTVQVVVSKGPQLYPVPEVVGMSVDDAVSTLQEAGFTASPQGFPEGTVRFQRPGAGERHPHGTTVTFVAY